MRAGGGGGFKEGAGRVLLTRRRNYTTGTVHINGPRRVKVTVV